MTAKTPKISEREAQPYHAIAAPFWRYLTIEMPDRLEIECGVPVGAAVPGDARVLAGGLPAGHYATVLHVGHPDELVETTAGYSTGRPGRDSPWTPVPISATGAAGWRSTSPIRKKSPICSSG